MKAFLERKGIEFSLKRYGIDALSFMALGLFSSLIIGLIISQIGLYLSLDVVREVGGKIMSCLGVSIGVAVAYGLKAPPLVIFSCASVGFVANELGSLITAFIATCIATELGKIVSKETQIDIILTPLVTLASGICVAFLIGPSLAQMLVIFGTWLNEATHLAPLLMGVILSVSVGVLLTLPVSSAAIAIMIGLNGEAAAAACVGCCCQMVGFAVASYKENGLNGLFSQGLGTSMLQIPNIVKNPKIWIAPILSSAILGPVAIMVFDMQNIPSGAGMGTSGFVGQFGTLEAMGLSGDTLIKILLMHFVLPAALTLAFSEFFYKIGWIKKGDMRLKI